MRTEVCVCVGGGGGVGWGGRDRRSTRSSTAQQTRACVCVRVGGEGGGGPGQGGHRLPTPDEHTHTFVRTLTSGSCTTMGTNTARRLNDAAMTCTAGLFCRAVASVSAARARRDGDALARHALTGPKPPIFTMSAQ
jgi:hypothetical protein